MPSYEPGDIDLASDEARYITGVALPVDAAKPSDTGTGTTETAS
jgi:hypothetical protein